MNYIKLLLLTATWSNIAFGTFIGMYLKNKKIHLKK